MSFCCYMHIYSTAIYSLLFHPFTVHLHKVELLYCTFYGIKSAESWCALPPSLLFPILYLLLYVVYRVLFSIHSWQ